MMMKTHVLLALGVFPLLPHAAGAQTLQSSFTADSTPFVARLHAVPHVDIFASGAVRDPGAKAESPASVTGALGLRYRGAVFVVTGVVNVAAKQDTVRADYGASLLPPASGQALNTGLLDIRAPRLPFKSLLARCQDDPDQIPCHIGLHAYVSASSARWALAVDSANVVTSATVVPSWGSGLGLSYTFVNGMLTDSNRVAMVLDAGIATRSIRGDITARDSVRMQLLNTTSKNFIGGEVSLNLQYNMIQAGLTYYYMSGQVDGFSRGQVVAGVSIQSNLNSKPIKR